MPAWPGQFFRQFYPDDAPALQVRLFRLFCATTTVLCLGVILPINLQQNLPVAVNVGVVVLGLAAAWCLRASARGRHHFTGYFVLLLALIDPIWFLNAGSTGSVPYYFFPVLLYPLAIFSGRLRGIMAALLALDFFGLLLVEYYFPRLTVPFPVPRDRLLDLLTGAGCSMLGLGVLVWLMVSAHEREQERISRYARELAAEEENYRAIFNSTTDALFIYDTAGRLVDVNAGVCQLYGCDRATVLRQTFDDRSLGASPYGRTEAEAKLQLALTQGPQVFPWRSRRSNGELFWSEVALRATEIAGQRRVIASVRDISPRMAVEAALRTQEERLRLALAASDQGWFDLNLVTGEGVASGEYARIIGLEPVEFKVTAQAWLEGIHPEDRELMQREFQACLVQGGTRTMEYRRKTVSGEWKWIRSTGKIVEREAGGRALRMTGTHADITERKKLEARLLHSQRLEAVGTLASGVAHDLNNILTPMLMVTGVLADKLADPADRALLANIGTGAARGAAIVRQLLAFSRDLAQSRSAVDLALVVRETMDIMRGTFPRAIELSARVPEGLWPVSADATQLHQVLMNLCINARDAMPAGGTLVISAENLAAGDGGTGPERAVRLAVTDTGQGIPPENLGRIFDPFFTTKGVGRGTGLGLSTVHGIVKSHGGTIAVESEVNRGTTFWVTLPASATAPVVAPATAVPPPPMDRPVVLVVDDEPAVLATTARALQREGCEVLAARGGDEALQLFGDRAGAVKLVITDIMMPGMDGLELVPLLVQLQPALRVIGVSGLDYATRSAELTGLGFAEVLQKPYDAATLLAAVRRQLGSGA